jgi:hypothetical protein
VVDIKYTYFNIKGLRARIQKFKRLHYNAMKRLWRDATREFIKEAVANVHVLSGMSAASFYPLANRVGYTIHKGGRARKGLTLIESGRGVYYKNRYSSVSEGMRLGQRAFKYNVGSEIRPFMVFEFRITVWQHAFHDDSWQSIRSGFEAFENYIRENAENYLPKDIGDLLLAEMGTL